MNKDIIAYRMGKADYWRIENPSCPFSPHYMRGWYSAMAGSFERINFLRKALR